MKLKTKGVKKHPKPSTHPQAQKAHQQTNLANFAAEPVIVAVNEPLVSLAEQTVAELAPSLPPTEWTMFSEMTHTELYFSFFGAFLAVVVIPLFALLVLKSEGKQAKYRQIKRQIEQDRVVVGAEPTSSSHNFKLVQTWGLLTKSDPLEDSMFGLTVGNALRLRRRVEMYQYAEKPPATESLEGSDDEEQETTSVDDKFELKFNDKLIESIPHHNNRQNPTSFPFKSQQQIVRKATLNNFELDQTQCAKLGRYQTLTLTDEIKDQIVATIKNKKEFAHFTDFERYKDYLLCRVESSKDSSKQAMRPGIGMHGSSRYRFGDVRVLFEVVPCDTVSLCGQQIQIKQGRGSEVVNSVNATKNAQNKADELKGSKFMIRRWDPSSLGHKTLPNSANDSDEETFALENVDHADVEACINDEATESEDEHEEHKSDSVSVVISSKGKLLKNNDKKEGPANDTHSQFSSPCKLPLQMVNSHDQTPVRGDDTVVSQEAVKVIKQIEKDMQEELTPGLWPYYVDFILANLFDESILLCANGEEKLVHSGTNSKGLVGPTSDYFKDNEVRMRFALWFRPLLLLGLTGCFYVCLIGALQTDPAVFGWLKEHAVLANRIHEQVKEGIPLLEEISLTWSFSLVLFSAVLAGIVQLVISSIAWFSYCKPRSMSCIIGAGVAFGAIFANV